MAPESLSILHSLKGLDEMDIQRTGELDPTGELINTVHIGNMNEFGFSPMRSSIYNYLDPTELEGKNLADTHKGRHMIHSRDKKEGIGRIAGSFGPLNDVYGDEFNPMGRINLADIFDKELRGKGMGNQMYNNLINAVNELGYPVRSDLPGSVSDQAQRRYAAMKAAGKNVEGGGKESAFLVTGGKEPALEGINIEDFIYPRAPHTVLDLRNNPNYQEIMRMLSQLGLE
jgi:hypothetical protein